MTANSKRRLAAVLMADVEGYSRLMGRWEDQTHKAVRDAIATAAAQLAEYSGRFISSAGDSFLAEFDSAQNALRCALALREILHGAGGAQVEEQRLVFRMGIHLGDVIEEANDVFGDCVNIAARVQREALPGDLLVTRAVHDAVGNQLSIRFDAMGARHFKNIDRPIELFRVRRSDDPELREDPPKIAQPAARYSVNAEAEVAERTTSPVTAEPEAHEKVPALAEPRTRRVLPAVPKPGDKRVPRLAVLPFTNLSGDQQREFFSDGFTEDVTTNLSRFRDLAVIARNSAFVYKGHTIATTELGTKLDVDYVVEGSVRPAGKRIRITAMLVDARQGHQVWADRYDIGEEDVFEVQDEVARQVTQALAVRIEGAERTRALRAKPSMLQAYGLLLRGHERFYLYTRPGNGEARGLYKRASGLDPSFARAWSALSKTHNIDWRYHWSRHPKASLDHALELAKTSVSLDDLDARGHSELGFTYLYRKQIGLSIGEYERAHGLNPNDADVLAEMADALIYDGRPEVSVDLFHRAMRLNPFHPDWYYWYLGGALHQLHKYDEAIEVLNKMHDPTQAARLLASSHAHLGHVAEAKTQAARVLKAHPNFTLDYWATTQPFRLREDLDHFIEGLRKAGLK